jgi:hypothetical protein
MAEHKGEIVVGVLGQWASGKSTAASTLVNYLGGEDAVIFITDRILIARQAAHHILELEDSKVKRSIEDDGRQQLEGELAVVYLGPGEDLETIDLNTLLFDLHDEVYDDLAPGAYTWLDLARLELGSQIRERSGEGKPIVIEAGFGTNTKPKGENPFSHTISDLFMRLEESGVEPNQVKWILIEAGYEIRSERNRKRPDSVPAVEFDRFAADGGDLDPDHQKSWEEQGTTIKRVPNEHDDIEKFRADIIAAFEELYRTVLSTGYGKLEDT